MQDAYGAPVTFSENTVDPSVAIQMVHHGISAICIAAGVAALFVWFRFDLAIAVATFYAMASAGIFALCCFAIGGYEIDLTYVVSCGPDGRSRGRNDRGWNDVHGRRARGARCSPPTLLPSNRLLLPTFLQPALPQPLPHPTTS